MKQKDTIQLDATLTRAKAMALLRVLQQVTWPKVFPDAKPDPGHGPVRAGERQGARRAPQGPRPR